MVVDAAGKNRQPKGAGDVSGEFAKRDRLESSVTLSSVNAAVCAECGGEVGGLGSKGFCEDCREEICDADDCTNSLADNEGYDGYCGSCADERYGEGYDGEDLSDGGA